MKTTDMKKILFSAFMVILMLAAFSVSSFAATKQEVIDAAENAIPKGYQYLYAIQIENIMTASDVTPEQCDKLLEYIKGVDDIIDDRGHSLHLYTPEEVNAVLGYFDSACELMGYTYEVMSFDSDLSYHEGDVVYVLYDNAGELVGVFDGDQDPIRETGSASISNSSSFTRFTVVSLMGAAILAVGATLLMGKNKSLASV